MVMSRGQLEFINCKHLKFSKIKRSWNDNYKYIMLRIVVLAIRPKFFTSRGGNVGVLFAALAPVLIGLLGAGIDFAQYSRFRSELQSIADGASIAGARYFALAVDGKKIPANVAKEFSEKRISTEINIGNAKVSVASDNEEKSISVKISFAFKPTFLTALVENPINIDVTSTAQAIGSSNICVIALSDHKKGALTVEDSATLLGDNCAVYSNSTHNKAISSRGVARVETAFNCSSGGFDGMVNSFQPAVVADCPPREDPLKDHIPPSAINCTLSVNLVANANTTISPGVYCNGLTIAGNSVVTMRPGVYVIKDSKLEVKDTASVSGDGVSFYFAGTDPTMNFGPDTTIELSAPEAGPMAGILMYRDRDSNHSHKFTISSNNAKTLVGTIYLPSARLTIDSDAPVAASSAYTAILAEEIEVKNSGTLVLNSDYAATGVPVPEGLVGVNGSIKLRK